MITRLAKFSAVGALGIVLQVAVLWLLTRLRLNYVVATGLAVEAAILHNFLWHQRFTWIDRNSNRLVTKRLFRFHLSNGAVSPIGNLLIMRCLVGLLGIPLLPANLLSIAACACVNFMLSDRWVFLTAQKI